MKYDILTKLVRQRSSVVVDEVLGRILEVDRKRTMRSRFTVGGKQIVQDIQIETPDRDVIAIAFYGLNLRCFTKQKGDEREVNFEPRHKGLWIKVSNTNREAGKEALKTVPSTAQASIHYATKRGVHVLLKATRTVSVQWVTKAGPQPTILNTKFEKQEKKLEVPGQQPEKPMTAKEPTMDPQTIIKNHALAFVFAMTEVQKAYTAAAKEKKIPMPKSEDLRGAYQTVTGAVIDNVNVMTVQLPQLKAAAMHYANALVELHIAMRQTQVQATKKVPGFMPVPDENLPSAACGRFINMTFWKASPPFPKPPTT